MTFSSESNGKKVCTNFKWDTASASFQPIGYDTLFISGNFVTKSIVSLNFLGMLFDIRASAIYDETGNETEELQTAETFLGNYSSKILQTFDNHNNLLTSIQQDSSDGWMSLDSCPKKLFTYAYDNAELVVSRKDSLWYSPDSIVVEKHFFTYQPFISAVLPRPSNIGAAAKGFSISHNGMVTISSPVSVKVYTISGKSIGEAKISSSGSLWKALRNGNSALSKGMYLAKIQGISEPCTVWHE